jgi:hypothetical protein
MLIKKTSSLTGIIHQKEINITQEQLDKWKSGVLIQNVMPHLSADDREFLISGTTSEEWDEYFKEDEEYEMEDLRDPNGNS